MNLIGNVSLGVAALSYDGRLGILVVADRGAYPDLDVFTAGATEELRWRTDRARSPSECSTQARSSHVPARRGFQRHHPWYGDAVDRSTA